jgi:hypothetical protein
VRGGDLGVTTDTDVGIGCCVPDRSTVASAVLVVGAVVDDPVFWLSLHAATSSIAATNQMPLCTTTGRLHSVRLRMTDQPSLCARRGFARTEKCASSGTNGVRTLQDRSRSPLHRRPATARGSSCFPQPGRAVRPAPIRCLGGPDDCRTTALSLCDPPKRRLGVVVAALCGRCRMLGIPRWTSGLRDRRHGPCQSNG